MAIAASLIVAAIVGAIFFSFGTGSGSGSDCKATGCTATIPLVNVFPGLDTSLAVAADGDTVLVVSNRSVSLDVKYSLNVYSLAQQREIARRILDLPAPAHRLAVSPQGDWAAIVLDYMANQPIHLIRVADGTRVSLIPDPISPLLRFSADGRVLFTGFTKRHAWQVPEGTPWNGAVPSAELNLDHDDDIVMATTWSGAVTATWHKKNFKLSVMRAGGPAQVIADLAGDPAFAAWRSRRVQLVISPDEATLAAVWLDDSNSRISLWRLADGTHLRTVTVSGRVGRQIAVAPGSRRFAVLRNFSVTRSELTAFDLP
ncbi:hypothetical protein [Reyranella sp. CPCC 100927]|uniref:hypothetical protein n=1 Tax=Reyranella sp. CPCC 100927 TaxID=2599616 RepID=UPI0011B70FF1|nr:hypothetical protein [Reyranella sp. CPCC 100927]TWT02013.1 hypothetical protein FQU96_31020 [Reyranella sp. CPCC 100927]